MSANRTLVILRVPSSSVTHVLDANVILNADGTVILETTLSDNALRYIQNTAPAGPLVDSTTGNVVGEVFRPTSPEYRPISPEPAQSGPALSRDEELDIINSLGPIPSSLTFNTPPTRSSTPPTSFHTTWRNLYASDDEEEGVPPRTTWPPSIRGISHFFSVGSSSAPPAPAAPPSTRTRSQLAPPSVDPIRFTRTPVITLDDDSNGSSVTMDGECPLCTECIYHGASCPQCNYTICSVCADHITTGSRTPCCPICRVRWNRPTGSSTGRRGPTDQSGPSRRRRRMN